MRKLLLLFLLSFFLFLSCQEKEKNISQYAKYLLVDKSGKEIPIPEDKLIFLNFMAYSCTSCMKELPIIKKVLKEKPYKDRFVFIGCVIDTNKNDLSDPEFPMYACSRANFVRFPVPGTPTTYIITPKGKKLVVIFGAVTEENLRKFLNQAIKKYEKIKEKSL